MFKFDIFFPKSFFFIALVRQFFHAKFKWKELGSKVPFVPKMSNLNLWTFDVSRPNLVRFGTKFWTSCPHTQFSAYPVDSAFWLYQLKGARLQRPLNFDTFQVFHKRFSVLYKIKFKKPSQETTYFLSPLWAILLDLLSDLLNNK